MAAYPRSPKLYVLLPSAAGIARRSYLLPVAAPGRSPPLTPASRHIPLPSFSSYHALLAAARARLQALIAPHPPAPPTSSPQTPSLHPPPHPIQAPPGSPRAPTILPLYRIPSPAPRP